MYIILLIAYVFEESAVSNHIVVVQFIADLRHWVFQHVVVYVQMIYRVVYVENHANDSRHYPLHRGRLEVYKLHYRGHDDIEKSYFMHFMRNRKYFGSVARVPMTTFALIRYDQQNPACNNQKNRNIAVVDEETGLPCSLKSPVHRISTKQSSPTMNLLRISDLILHCRRHKSFCLV